MGFVLSHSRAAATRVGTRLLAALCLVFATCLLAAAGAAAAASQAERAPAHRPVVSAVRPGSASTAGGSITVTGRGFTGTRAVSLLILPTAAGAVRPAPDPVPYTVVSDRTLRLTVPAHAAGTVWIRVTAKAGASVYGPADRLEFAAPVDSGTAMVLAASTHKTPAPPPPSPPGKDALGALLLAVLLGMIFGRSKNP
jgi:hypothetical protein